MIKQPIWTYVRLGMELADFHTLLFSLEEREPESVGLGAPAFKGTKIEDLSPEMREDLRKFIGDLIKIATELNLRTSRALLHEVERDLPESQQAFHYMETVIRAEIKSKLFLYIPSDRARFYEYDNVLSEKARDAFPSAYKELKEAGSCYAAERYTACVFHAMRAAEIGLRALGHQVGVSFPDKPLELAEWQNIIQMAEARIKEIVDKQSKGLAKDEDQKFYGQAAAQFRYFKDGWRIRVAHARETYVGSQAYAVLSHARDFFETLAERLREPDA